MVRATDTFSGVTERNVTVYRGWNTYLLSVCNMPDTLVTMCLAVGLWTEGLNFLPKGNHMWGNWGGTWTREERGTAPLGLEPLLPARRESSCFCWGSLLPMTWKIHWDGMEIPFCFTLKLSYIHKEHRLWCQNGERAIHSGKDCKSAIVFGN